MGGGRYNVAIGLFALASFMVLGFVLIYLRDFAPGKEQWVADYAVGKHFETRLAHVHGALFGFLNVALGFVLAGVEGRARGRAAAAVLGIVGLLMPVGILLEVVLGAPPVFVVVGAASMVAAVVLTGVLALQGWRGLAGPGAA